jgi:hypothetical protein
LIARIAIARGWDDDGSVRCLIGVLVIAVFAAALPIGACCVSVAPSHACCKTESMRATTAAVVKPTVTPALSNVPLTMRVVATVTHQRFCTIASTRSLESNAPLPLRI